MNKRLAMKVEAIKKLHSRDMKIQAIKDLGLSRDLTLTLICDYVNMPTLEDTQKYVVKRFNECAFA